MQSIQLFTLLQSCMTLKLLNGNYKIFLDYTYCRKLFYYVCLRESDFARILFGT